MSISRISVDTDTLPDALLVAIKAHTRVEHTRDDSLLKTYIAASISLVERKCNVSLNPASYEVSGGELDCAGTMRSTGSRSCWRLPVNNVHQFVVMQSGDPGAPDISTDYELWNSDFGGNASSYLCGIAAVQSAPSSAVLTLSVGVSDPIDLAPAFFVVIARLVASMYENREASSALMDDGFADELSALWRTDA